MAARISAAALFLAFAPVAAGAQTTTATFSAIADTYLRQGAPNQNQGDETILRVRQSGRNRALFRVDATAIASTLGGATLRSAHLELFIAHNGDNWGGTGRTVDAHRLTAPWTEEGATWNCAEDAVPGNQQAECSPQWNGGSFAITPTASVLHVNGASGWIRYDVTADVAAFLSGAPHHGWLLKKTDEGESGLVEYSAREVGGDLAPRLVVVYELANGEDTSAPSIAELAPANGSLLAPTHPLIAASFSDDGSGVDPTSVVFLLDGVDRTPEAQINAGGLTWSPAQALSDGFHVADVTVRDLSGNAARVAWGFTVDATPPSLTIVSPGESVVVGSPRLDVALTFDDATSGIDWPASSVQIDGVEVSGSCGLDPGSAHCAHGPLSSGTHRVAAAIRDRAGNTATVSRDVDLVIDQEPPMLTLEAPSNGAYVREPSLMVAGTVADVSGIDFLSVNGQELTANAGQYQTAITLQEGANSVAVVARDLFGYLSTAEAKLVLDTTPPTLELASPGEGQITNQATIRVAGLSQDSSGLVALSVNGQEFPNADGRFDVELPLAEGANALTVRAVDRAGNQREVNREVFRYTLPAVSIDFPADLSFLAATTTEVRGRVDDPLAAVTVNGISAEVAQGSFVARDVPLIEGGNIVTATARSSTGRVGTESIQVVRDLFPPRLAVEHPRNGAIVFSSSVTVFGLVNDIVAGTVNASEASVTVNGRQAEVANRSFLLEDVPLVLGENVLTVEAVDASGNSRREALVVYRAEPSGPRLVALSEDRQQAVIGQPLAEPLVIELVDVANQPLPGRTVLFKVRGGDGVLSGGKRQLAVTTDATGRAATTFTLGLRAGTGNQRVEASVVGLGTPAVFAFDALPSEPVHLFVDAGNQQIGIAGQPLPRPLVAVVTDAGFNRLPAVAVEWAVVKGRGHFLSGEQELLASSDSDGRVIVPFVLEPDEGIANNVVEARIAGLEQSPVVAFVASGLAASADPAATSVSGVVLDNTNDPIAGATLRVLETQLTGRTDAQGQFRIVGVPVGTLRLIVDGNTVEHPGSWPDLEFVVTTVPGRDNPLTMPVYILKLELANGLLVDETRGGTLSLPDVPGFSLEIAPGSVTFPGGSRSGVVSVTTVHSDKVPMVPNFGQQPRFIVTIQPAGARFEPPAKLTLPNLEGLRPGEVTELYSFDHDLGHFVSIGPGTVSEDGALIVSNPGVGILKAGWHCGGNPATTGTSHACPPCHVCNGSQCVPGCALPATAPGAAKAADSCDCSEQDPCTVGNRCTGQCRPLQEGTVTALAEGLREGAVKPKGKAIVFSPTDLNVPNCSDFRYEWTFDDGERATTAVVGHAFVTVGTHTAILKIRCGACEKVLAKDDVQVSIIGVDIRVTAGATQQNVTGAKNWATIKGTGLVELEAVLTPPNPAAARRVQWSGATPVPGSPHRATLAKAEAARRTVTAHVDDFSDTVDIWVVWVELELRNSGMMSPNNNGLIQTGDGFPNLGPMTDEDSAALGFTKAEAAGNVEVVGHLQPLGVHVAVKAGWDLERRRDDGFCTNGHMLEILLDKDDTSDTPFKDLEPESDDRIYDKDAPTAGNGFQVNHTVEIYLSFRQYASWNGRIASADMRWHYHALIDDDLDIVNRPVNRDTVLNDVGLGPVDMPQTCHFQAR